MLKVCAGIVSMEGSIASMEANIARKLKKPGVVSIKLATNLSKSFYINSKDRILIFQNGSFIRSGELISIDGKHGG